MSRVRALLAFSVISLAAKAWCEPLTSVLLSPNSPPAGCKSIAGQYPVGDRTPLLWDYERYAVVMPPYKHKQAQSFECGPDKGTLYFFEYATPSQKDRALLFARPVLHKQEGLLQELPVREWSTGFVVVSFLNPPQDLLHALDDRLTPHSAPSVPPAIPKVKTVPAAWSSVIKEPAPAQQLPPIIKKEPTPELPPIETSKPAVEEASAPVAEAPKPSMPLHPFEAIGNTRALTATKPVVERPVPPPPPSAPVVVRERPRPLVVRKPAAPNVPVVVAPAVPAGTADLSSSVIETYASKMGCESVDKNVQTQTVCGYLQEFASGLPPELPLNAAAVLIGPVYTIDSNGRFTDLHYDVLMGTHDPSTVSFFALPSTGGKDDFEIKQLIEARKAKAPLPVNDTSAKLHTLEAPKRMGLRKSAMRSAILQPAPDRRIFIRRANDHLVLLGVSGATPEAQKNTSLVVIILY